MFDGRTLKKEARVNPALQPSFLSTGSMSRMIGSLMSGVSTLWSLRIEDASANLAGEDNLVIVRYKTNKKLRRESVGGEIYLLDQASGRRLTVKHIPYMGSLFSRTYGPTSHNEGYFIVDNIESIVSKGSIVTVVVGSLKKENIIVKGN